MIDNQNNKYDIGILGGGQLGRMLLLALADLGCTTTVLDSDVDAPSKHFCNAFVDGSFQDYETVLSFGRRCKTLTIEIEHINVDALKVLEKEGVKIYPQPACIETIQSKVLQKKFYLDNQLPTTPYILLSSPSEAKNHLDLLPAYFKYAKGGYDGKGVIYIDENFDFGSYLVGEGILEKEIKPVKEVSVIVARAENGIVKTYPAVDMISYPSHNMLKYLSSPSVLSVDVLNQLDEIAQKTILALDMIGILAVEFFVDIDNQVYINEIAPRPHNSGHHTIEANKTSQYDQFLRAIMGWPLGDTSALMASVMVNLLGEEGFVGDALYEGMENVLNLNGVNIHLYGKKITKPYRKMGHVTIVDATLDKAIEKGKIVKNTLKVKS
jgi:5-(carboxyamino)imidazole ribonucleotide synthase